MSIENKEQLANLLYGGFYRCPTTNRVLPALHGDDKVLCNCRKSNPECRQEETERTGVHIIRFLKSATVADYVKQHEKEKNA